MEIEWCGIIGRRWIVWWVFADARFCMCVNTCFENDIIWNNVMNQIISWNGSFTIWKKGRDSGCGQGICVRFLNGCRVYVSTWYDFVQCVSVASKIELFVVYDKISWHKCYKTIEKCFL